MGERPRDLSPGELGFVPQKAVHWLNPAMLAGTAVRVLLAHLFGGYLDKRELQAALPDDSYSHANGDELWFDYAADVGDGFDATYSVGHLLAQPQLDVDGAGSLPRGALLVLGGDQVYPTASATAYENRWKGPYRAALPELAADSPTLYALPGNHDWYDGLTAFLRLFAQSDPIGGWRTQQARSYFALALPHRWWLLAVDIQLTSYIDEPQLDYFKAAVAELGPDDRIILVPARPAWAQAQEHADAYDSLDYFIRTVIDPTEARIPLVIAGDMHHYARYSGVGPDGRGRQLITAGGGGAYLLGTDHLPTQTTVPPPESVIRRASAPQTYRLDSAFPDQRHSRRLGWGIFHRLPLRNPGFVGLLGVVQTLLMLALLTSDGQWVNGDIAGTVAAVFAGTLLFALVPGQRGHKHWIAGVVHGLPHVALGIAGAVAWSALPFIDTQSPWNVLLAFVLYLPVAGLLDAWIVGAYLLVARYVKINVNELYAGLGIDDLKSFLRLHIGRDGSLTVYPVGVDRVCRHWRADPSAPPGAPWVAPAAPIPTRLIEQPIVVD